MSHRPTGAPPPRLVAVLGPTNTGKTHLAVERMLGHASGMIGLPLRLLAREIYDRVVKARGATRVALITGEEKIVPPRAHYWVCTVEAMPLSREVEFLALGIGAELDLVHRQELNLARERHGLDGADEIGRSWRDDLFLAGYQGDGAGAPLPDDAVIDLAGQQAQRQADHPRGVTQHPFHGQVGLAGIGRAQNSDQAGRGCAGRTITHLSKVVAIP